MRFMVEEITYRKKGALASRPPRRSFRYWPVPLLLPLPGHPFRHSAFTASRLKLAPLLDRRVIEKGLGIPCPSPAGPGRSAELELQPVEVLPRVINGPS